MSSVKKYFSMKLLKTQQKMSDVGGRKLKKIDNEKKDRQDSISVSDEDLIEGIYCFLFIFYNLFRLINYLD